MPKLLRCIAVVFVCAAVATTASALTYETVPVWRLGNTGELSGAGAGGAGPDRVCGAVDYAFEMGTYEVTAEQWMEFLNAVAVQSDPYGLYNPQMDPANYGSACNIIRSGSAGSYSYSVGDPTWANRPVNKVSYGDAMRFANWLHNGQPTGVQDDTTTEDGAYDLNGAMTNAELLAVTRKPGWQWAVPTEDEWYKAAYHKNDGATGNYWDFATGTDATPSNESVNPDPGNNGNFEESFGDLVLGAPYYRTPVGAFENSESPYGTFDQLGNMWEWTEEQRTDDPTRLALRGGAYSSGTGNEIIDQMANYRGYSHYPSTEGAGIGFRLVAVPEPTTLALLGLGGLAALRRRRNA
jgi:formylglycine-generating enzyme required for sulfatase activity